MSEDQKAQLVANLVTPLKTVPRFIQLRQLGHFYKADPDHGSRVARGLGIAEGEVWARLGAGLHAGFPLGRSPACPELVEGRE